MTEGQSLPFLSGRALYRLLYSTMAPRSAPPRFQDHCIAAKSKEEPVQPHRFFLVELVGIEPTTPCLQSRCSSQLSYSPSGSYHRS